ncbi:MAG: hypothetical protein GWN07_07540, partial [Actinobacteria bacterium]|nr:hypothetical protein [Actinomycetota bacterium]
SPRVETPRDINLHYCRYVAEAVLDRLPDDAPVRILEDGGRGYVHTWLFHDGRHYDAECLDGAPDYRDLPFFRRHPEAAVHVEPETADPAALRQRGREPLYPAVLSRRAGGGPKSFDIRYWRWALGAFVLGASLFAVGLAGEWAVAHRLLGPGVAPRLFLDLELLGEVIVLVGPVVFFVLLPAHRANGHP